MKSHAIQTKIARHIILILVALFLAGCSGPPSESVGRRILEKQVQDDSEGLIKLVSFRKTNATGGGSRYQMEYEVEIEFTDDVTVFESDVHKGPFYAKRGFSQPRTVSPSVNGDIVLLGKRKGETMKRAGTLHFEKTEKGWRDSYGNVY